MIVAVTNATSIIPSPYRGLFNFNNPLGACPTCEGFGDIVDVDMDLVVPDKSLTLAEGAIAPWTTPAYEHELDELLALADDYDIPTDVPFKKLKKKHLRLIARGVPERDFGGLDGFFAWLDRHKYKMHVRIFATRFRSYRQCEDCGGKRFKPEALAYRSTAKNVADLLSMQADQAERVLRIASTRAAGGKNRVRTDVADQRSDRLPAGRRFRIPAT